MLLAAAMTLAAQSAVAQTTAAPSSADAALGNAVGEALALTRSGVRLPAGARLEIVPGQLDPRLRLAPCQKVEPYLPPGAPPWGRTRVGLRCASGAVPWNVYLPVTVKVWAPALVTRNAVAAGTTLTEADLTVADVDIAAEPQPTFSHPQELTGRLLASHLPPGTAVRSHHLRQRSWFQAGEQITVLAAGPGYGVTLTGQAMNAGLEGQAVRVRTESGRILTAWPVAENRAELR